MKLKLLIKYLLLYLPFILGMVCYTFGIVNLISSMLLFLGGYVAIKNTIDYRKVRKNRESVEVVKKYCSMDGTVNLNKGLNRQVIKSKNVDNIMGIKRVRRYSRVRRKY